MNNKILGLAVGLLAGAFSPTIARADGEAKNVIVFIGDGMGPAVVTAARLYQYGEEGKLNMERYFDRTAKVKTFSKDAQTTDSAPSMSAYMTGVKMSNDVISMSSDTVADKTRCVPGNGTSVSTLLELAKAKGKAVGSVTTTEATHATPAATYAHICHRDLAEAISVQAVPGGTGYNSALGDGLDVLFGGGANYWTPFNATTNPKGRSDLRDLVSELKTKGYAYAGDKAAFDALSSTATKAAGFFSATSHMSFELDRDATKQPSIGQMTSKAIDVLVRASAGKGFFLMVEGGRIDHALHSTNAKRALVDAIAFDDAIKVALDKVDLKETLVIVTADHDHTMVINGYSKKGNPVLDVVRDVHTGDPSLDAEGFPYPTLGFGNGESRPDLRSVITSAEALGNDFHQLAGVKMGAGSETHGGGDVMLMATGAGSKGFKGTIDNTKVFALIKAALGL